MTPGPEFLNGFISSINSISFAIFRFLQGIKTKITVFNVYQGSRYGSLFSGRNCIHSHLTYISTSSLGVVCYYFERNFDQYLRMSRQLSGLTPRHEGNNPTSHITPRHAKSPGAWEPGSQRPQHCKQPKYLRVDRRPNFSRFLVINTLY